MEAGLNPTIQIRSIVTKGQEYEVNEPVFSLNPTIQIRSIVTANTVVLKNIDHLGSQSHNSD